MDDSMKLYCELYFDSFSNEEIIQQTGNPIREYEEELIEGPIIDIGCGQSSYLLEFLNTDREIYAVDNEQVQLDYLKKRVIRGNKAKLDQWHFKNLNFPEDILPDRTYSLIILSNILHFFPLKQCLEIGKKLVEFTEKGSMVFIGVHSRNYYMNDPKNPNNNEYFKHYFTIKDLEKIFPKKLFEKVYSAEIEKVDTQSDKEITNRWLDKSLDADGITDPRHRAFIKKNYLKTRAQSDIQMIFRKR